MKLTVEQYDAIEKCVNKILENRKLVDAPKQDPEAWRAVNLAKQAAGAGFEHYEYGAWRQPNGYFDFTGKKEDYREVQEATKAIVDTDGNESDARIPEAARDVLKEWRMSGLKFKFDSLECHSLLDFNGRCDRYSIPEQPIPEGMSVKTVEAMWRQGLSVEYGSDDSDWTRTSTSFLWKRENCGEAELLKRLRIPAQSIPEKLLEAPKPFKETWTAIVPDENAKPTIPHLVKPKTVTYAFVFCKSDYCSSFNTVYFDSAEKVSEYAKNNGYTIIGNIETREVEIE